IGPEQMLFFNPGDCKVAPAPFRTAMESLMNRGLVVKERPKQAYSLTRSGYQLSLSPDVRKCTETKAPKARGTAACRTAAPIREPSSSAKRTKSPATVRGRAATPAAGRRGRR